MFKLKNNSKVILRNKITKEILFEDIINTNSIEIDKELNKNNNVLINNLIYSCPTCKCCLNNYDWKSKQFKYCPECGQRLK